MAYDGTIHRGYAESDVANAKDFFALFSPVFERNGKWSTSRKVPSLGDTNSKIDNVRSVDSFRRYVACCVPNP